MMVTAFALGLLISSIVVLLRFVFIFKGPSAAQQLSRLSRPLNVCVVLGSGGHTSEMFATIGQLPKKSWSAHRPFYVRSATDRDSAAVATKFESEMTNRCARCLTIPRAREVGQSYVTSVVSTLRAFVAAVKIVWCECPEIILTNGPGVCVPVVFASLLIATVTSRKRASVAYFESFTCVDHLSLSGKILLRIADVFTVQWEELLALLAPVPPSVRFTGPELDGSDSAPLLTKTGKKALALVTVGSTQFNALMQCVDSRTFFRSLRSDYHIEQCIVQRGRTSYKFDCLGGSDTGVVEGVSVTVVDYKPFLQADIKEASLVISHAGAGTILEAMAQGTEMIVVPNEQLMSNHQVQLAKALCDKGYLHLVYVHELEEKLRSLGRCPVALRRFPNPNQKAIHETFEKIYCRRM